MVGNMNMNVVNRGLVLKVHSMEFSCMLVDETSRWERFRWAGINCFEMHIKEQVTNRIIWDEQHGNAIERAQMLPRQGEMGENTLFTRKCTSELSESLERVTKDLKKWFNSLYIKYWRGRLEYSESVCLGLGPRIWAPERWARFPWFYYQKNF